MTMYARNTDLNLCPGPAGIQVINALSAIISSLMLKIPGINSPWVYASCFRLENLTALKKTLVPSLLKDAG